MRYLQHACDLVEARGYLRYPEVLALQDRVPAWFRLLGNPDGLADFEARRGVRVPDALREFYAYPLLACFLEASIDGEVFLAGMMDPDPPPQVAWSSGQHLVFAFHGHSGMVLAAVLRGDDPPVAWGFEDEEPSDQASAVFSDWVLGVVDGYERNLDYWQGVYEKCIADTNEARRLGGVEWIRRMPGMARRLGGQA